MKDPIEIIARGFACENNLDDFKWQDWKGDAEIAIRALEAAGGRIVFEDEVTEEMMIDAIKTYAATKQAGGELHNAVAAAIRAARKYGGGK